MKTITAILVASGLAVSMIPATSAFAQMQSESILNLQFDGATVEQISSATNAVVVYVGNSFELEMAPANIADVRSALDANGSLNLFLDSNEIDIPDVVGVAENGENTLSVFVTRDS